jgi:uncharacterized membrane protein YhdT
MKKIAKFALKLIGLYLIGWIILWVVAVLCGSPANLNQWSEGPRIASGLIIVPIISGLLITYYYEKLS